ncbi:hypothetical protein T484DRAFT_1644189, partial [Baffinella frigidus]
NPKPETQNPKPEARNPKPETRNPKPGTRNPEPETRNPEPETRSPKPETRHPKPDTRNPKPAANSRSLRTGRRCQSPGTKTRKCTPRAVSAAARNAARNVRAPKPCNYHYCKYNYTFLSLKCLRRPETSKGSVSGLSEPRNPMLNTRKSEKRKTTPGFRV